MSDTTQDNRLLKISTPLGKDKLLLNRLTVTEEISSLFSYEVELLHDDKDKPGFEPTPIDAKTLLGQAVGIYIDQRDGTIRELGGMINHFSQGHRDKRFSYYYASIVPYVWLLTQISQSRIFQHKSVPDILKIVFKGFEVSYELQATYEPRNYCVQYRETDWDFASRLMEEEGIFYYFDHTDGKNKMIVADTPQSHRDCPSKSDIPFALKVSEEEDFITSIKKWQNDHRLQSGKISFWDFNFQVPSKKLDVTASSIFSVADNDKLEVYDFPAGYARKFDDIDRGGGERSDVSKVFQDNEKTATVAMQALDSQYRVISGSSDCSSLTAGYRFKFLNHPTAAQNQQYVITSVTHEAEQNPTYETDDDIEKPYNNSFTCIAYGSGAPPFRPARKTFRPTIHGSQTAFVVGPAGEEIFTDKFGRVKVQFHWDREAQSDPDSSCWVRVSQAWAGNGWGAMFIPRIGMEVVVHFLEGDPDQPIITGCVYNPATMPPYKLPDHKTKMTIKSNSSKGGGGFNEFRFEDKKGSEQVFLHGQKDQDIRIKNTRREYIGNDRHLIVYRDKREQVKRDKHIIVERDEIKKIERDYHRHVEGKIAFKTDGSVSHDIGGGLTEKIGGSHSEDTGDTIYLKAGMKVIVEAGTQITLKVGGNFVDIGPAGVTIVGTMVKINSGGAPGSASPGSLVPPLDPDEAEIADNADPGSDSPTYKNQRRQIPAPKVPTYTKPSHKPKSPKNKNKKSWIEIELLDEQGNPVAGERYRVTLTDGTTIAEGTTDENGFARVSKIDPGNCKITFPNLDREAWRPQ
jgi:type VI secretion system secreted protein VgrG